MIEADAAFLFLGFIACMAAAGIRYLHARRGGKSIARQSSV